MADDGYEKAQAQSDKLRDYGKRVLSFFGYGEDRKPKDAEEARVMEAARKSRADRATALGDYAPYNTGVISSTSEYGEPKRQYHRGGRIRKTGERGKDVVITAKEGERVLTEKEDRKYQRLKRQAKRGKRRQGRRT